MKMNVKICQCGHCDTFMDRAQKTVEKMILDGECFGSMAAVAWGIALIARSIATPQILADTGNDPANPDPVKLLFATQAAQIMLEGVFNNMEDFYQANAQRIVDEVNVVITRANAAHEAEGNLPKGH